MDAAEWDRRYAEAGLLWSVTPNQFVAAELAGLPPGQALDLACGEGRNAIWLAAQGWQVTAVDFSSVALDKARALHREHALDARGSVDWVHADVLALEPDTAAYDLAVLAYLQLPAGERRDSVRRAVTALREGGTLFVVGHDSSNLTEGTGGPQDAGALFTAQDILDDLDGVPTAVDRAERVTRTVVAADPSHRHEGSAERTAYDALVRLRRTS